MLTYALSAAFFVFFGTLLGEVASFQLSHSIANGRNARSMKPLREIPLELVGELDPTKSWEVELDFDGDKRTVTVFEDTSILEAAEKTFDNPPFSCRNGVCTTCSGYVTEGRQNVKLAVHGLSRDLLAQGYTLTCQTYVIGPGVKVILNKYDEVYYEQYGKHEIAANEEKKKKKVFGMF